jgi:hypothetical protein
MFAVQAAAASGSLNYPLAGYPARQDRQRFGPELNVFLLQLR